VQRAGSARKLLQCVLIRADRSLSSPPPPPALLRCSSPSAPRVMPVRQRASEQARERESDREESGNEAAQWVRRAKKLTLPRRTGQCKWGRGEGWERGSSAGPTVPYARSPRGSEGRHSVLDMHPAALHEKRDHVEARSIHTVRAVHRHALPRSLCPEATNLHEHRLLY
jgi:hypothetical protein